MLFAPIDCDLPQGLGAECKPGGFDLMPPDCVFKMPECPGAVEGVEEILANPRGLYRFREILHDGPLVHVELGGKSQETVCGGDSLGKLPLLLLPFEKIRLVLARLLRLTQKIQGDRFHLACLAIQEGTGLVELNL
jgi:hypothetical protein